MLLEYFNTYLVLRKQYFFLKRQVKFYSALVLKSGTRNPLLWSNFVRKKFCTHNRRNLFSRFAKKKIAKSSTREKSFALQCLSEVFLDMSQWGRTPVNGRLLKKKLLVYKRLFCSHQGKLFHKQILFFKDYSSRKKSLL